MEYIPAHRNPFQFIEILQFMHILSRGIVRDGKDYPWNSLQPVSPNVMSQDFCHAKRLDIYAF